MLLLTADPAGDRLLREAGRAEARFDVATAAQLARQALQHQPSSPIYNLELRRLLEIQYGHERGILRYEAVARDAFARCSRYSRALDFPALRSLKNTEADVCGVAMLAGNGEATPEEIARLRNLTEQPFAGEYAWRESYNWIAHKQPARANAALQRAAKVEQTPYHYVFLISRLETLLGKAEYRSTLEAALARSPYPATYYWYITQRSDPFTTPGVPETLVRVALDARQRGGYTECGNALTGVQNAYIDNGDMQSSIRIAPLAIACADRSENYEISARSRILYGRALQKAGHARQAVVVLRKAEPIARRAGYQYFIADAFHQLAHAYEVLGDHVNAQRAVEQFVLEARKMPLSASRMVSLRDAGIIFWDAGDRVGARRFFDELVRLANEQNHDHYWAGEYYERSGDLMRAREYYLKALATVGDSARKTAAVTRIYLAMGSIDSAEVAARLHDALPQTPEEIPLIPMIQAARGQYAAALKQAQSWASLQQKRGNITGAINAYLQVADIASGHGDSATVRNAAQNVLQLSRTDTVLEAQARAHAYLGDFTRALKIARRADNPGVITDVWTSIAAARGGMAPIDSALNARRRTVGRFEYGFDRVRYRNPVASLLDNIANKAIRAGDARMLYEASVRRKSERAPRVDLVQVQRKLPANTTIVDYTVTDSATAALVITHNSVDVVRLPTTRSAIRSLVDDLRRPTATQFGVIDLARAKFNYAAARAAYDALLRPLRLTNVAELRTSPDDALHFIPFDALIDGQQYVIERMAVALTPSADQALNNPPVSLGKVHVVASNAPGVADEVASLNRIVKTANGVSPDATVLHVATHAYADAARPLSSYFEMGKSRVGVNDIERMRLNADLVVFTACETVYGKLYAGGPFGLANAFRTAGAKAVVATLWPVGTISGDFTRSFYTALKQKRSSASALRSAKLQLKAETNNPLLWAPFVISQ